jgi:homoserine O-acetyltransferase
VCKFIAAGILSLALTVSRAAAQTAQAPQHFADLGDFKLVNGQSIRACKLGYRTLGRLNAAKSNAILFPTWFAAQSADVLGALSGKEPFFDRTPYFLIVVDALGDGVSCSPSTSSSQHGAAFPRFTIADMVEAEHALVTRTLGLSHLHAVVGFSMGGMQAFQWVVRYPEFMDEAISINGSPRLTSYDLLLYRTEIAAMPDMTVVHLIAAMNTVTPQYRVAHTSRSEFEKYYKEATAAPIGDGTFDGSDWRAQLEAVLALDVAHRGALSAAAARVRARMLIVASQQDHSVNPAPALEFARLLRAQTLVLRSDCGHLAPFCEIDDVRPVIDSFLRGGAIAHPDPTASSHAASSRRSLPT